MCFTYIADPSDSQQVRDESADVTLWTIHLQACGEGH